MKKIDGMSALCDRYRDHSDEGWILLENRESLSSPSNLVSARFIIPDDEDEEDRLLDIYPTFLEIPTFRAVIENEQKALRDSVNDVVEASLYYLEMDTFRD